jgi:hypothetical protein
MGPNNEMLLWPNEHFDKLDQEELRVFCHFEARYLLPSLELIEYLKSYIGDKKAIEIGSGAGDLARFLGIPATDNYNQEMFDVKMLMRLTQQPTVKYGNHVENLDALSAVKKHKPDIAIGAWVTHWIDPELPPPPGGGNVYGIKEEELLKLVDTYIMIGSQEVHKYKPIMKLPHYTVDAPFVRSRRKDNKIWIWRRDEATKHL